MPEDIISFIDMAIELELGAARLYNLFAQHCSEDFKFWIQLEMEEKNHAALLKAGKAFAGVNKFPSSMIPENLTQMRESLRQIENGEKKFLENPTRSRAFDIAFEIENSAVEMHYQQYMEAESDDDLAEIFKKLNRADSHHAERIKDYRDSIANL